MHFGDYTFIFVLALVLLGPKKMPEMARQLGKLLAEFRRASNEFKFQIQEELRSMEEEERKKKLAESIALAEASEKVLTEAGATSQVDAGPKILPPSTGERVNAARPFAIARPPSEGNGESAGRDVDLPETPAKTGTPEVSVAADSEAEQAAPAAVTATAATSVPTGVSYGADRD
jgi:sec-independent protein translocase protein TatB